MSKEKKVPNPYGRKGGLEHQAKVKEVAKQRDIILKFHAYNAEEKNEE